MIVCACTGTTEAEISRLVSEGATSVADIVRRTGAGRCCPPCRAEIGVLVDQGRASARDRS